MRTPKVIAILVAPLIALLLWGSVSASWGSRPLASDTVARPNSAQYRGVLGAAPDGAPALRGTPNPPLPTPTPTATRKRITFPGPVGTRLKLEPEATPTPTRRFQPNDGIVALTPGVFAPECVNQAQVLSPQPIQLTVMAGTQFQAVVTLKNTGSCAWGPGYAFAFQGKDSIGANPLDVDAGSVPAAATHTFILNMVAPAGGGYRVGLWAMKAAGGRLFGPLVTIIVGVTQ